MTTLKTAEALHLHRHPAYRRHSDTELISFVSMGGLRGRRNPSQMVAELLATREMGA